MHPGLSSELLAASFANGIGLNEHSTLSLVKHFVPEAGQSAVLAKHWINLDASSSKKRQPGLK